MFMPVVEGTAYWAAVKVPNTYFEPAYTVNLVVDPEVAESFKSQGFNIKQMEEGPALVIKRKVDGPNGLIRRAPDLLDRQKNPMDVVVGNGSRVRVQYTAYPWEHNGRTGKSLDFCKMQVIDLVEFQPVVDELEAFDDDEEIDEL
jgi:hypothetical protein|tara:strand:- start:6546 stop:6980 length:435 start_codon:yes stop_codon:yes gene_type:complete